VDSGVVDIDLFVAESAFQTGMLRRTVRTKLKGQTIWLVSPEDLLLLKLVADRPRDRAYVQDVLTMNPSIDDAHLDHWAERLGVLAHLAVAREEFRRQQRLGDRDRLSPLRGD
jgi:hypothetical protein